MKFPVKTESFLISALLVFTFLIKLAQVFYFKDWIFMANEDEIIYIENALKMLFYQMKPGLFFHGALYFNLLASLYFCFFAVGKVAGWFGSSGDFILFFLERPEVFYFLGRMFSVCISTAVVYLVYRLGTHLWDKRTGLLAALFVSLTPMVLMQGIKTSVYSAANFWIVAAAFYGLTSLKKDGLRHALAAGLVFGLALSADYYALFLLPFFAVLFCSRDRPRKTIADIFIFFVSALGVFFAVNPYLLLNPGTAWSSIGQQIDIAVFGEYGRPHRLSFYLRLLLTPPYLFVSGLFLVGAWFSLKNKKIWETALCLFPLANIVFFTFSKIQVEHYIFHAMPFLSLGAAHALTSLTQFRKSGPVMTLAFSFLFILFCGLNYKPDFAHLSAETWAAKAWIEKNIPKKSAIFMEPMAVPFGQANLFMILFNPINRSNEGLYFAVLDRYLQRHPEEDYEVWPCNLVKRTIFYLYDKDIHYIVLSESDYDQEGARWLRENAALVKAFPGAGRVPKIRIYKVLCPAAEKMYTARAWW